ncbi:S8 family peptidase [Streptomyces marincola]|uniref:Peptidase S8 n=1 Tax=Streptomyces marincola TaxID=2878388 RepID=A0A1W7CXD2_9ACTN|nr:peptidase S8 [Streptomyces marincola]
MAVMRHPRSVATATAAVLALGIGVALPASAADTDDSFDVRALIANADAPGTIDNSYIVRLHETALDAGSERAEDLAERYGAQVTDTFELTLNGYAVSATEDEAAALAAHPAVAEVVQNETVEIAATQSNPPSWGLDRIDQPNLPLNNSYTYPNHGGAGVTVYVVDTGIRYSHVDFEGRASFGFDAFGGNGNDGNGHGTHVAGTAAGASYGVAKDASLVSVKVLNDAGSGTTASVAGGVEWVTANADGPSVANLSLGGGANATIDAAVRASIASGVTYAVAAGNSYGANAGNYSPARVAEAITVASSTNTDARSTFSNIGSVVDIYAPGTSITSAWSTSNTATNTISGTSMASPHVAGAAALHLAENPSASPAAVRNALVADSVPVVTNAGSGTTNRLLQVG